MVSEYHKPARPGTIATFSCSPENILFGPNISNCTENGQWEPSISDVNCQPQVSTAESTVVVISTIHSDCVCTDDGKIAVASSVTAFVVGSILFFITGFLCGHFCRKEKKAMVPAASQCEKTTHGTPYYDDVVLNQQQELELKENVAYAPLQ